MKRIISLFCLALIGITAVAQNMTVKGTVKDSKDEPLIGVAVMLEGNSRVGTVTDVNGNYQITLPVGKGHKLVFSSIGYKDKIVELAGRAVVDVTLEDDSTMLEETVVVGYGAMRRSDLTGSLTSVKIDDDKAAKSSSLDQMLEGRAAGVQVLSSSSSPDAGVTIRVRGIASFSGNTDPLYVVDGVIVEGSAQSVTTMSVGSFTNAVETTNGLAGINPQDIASIEILKDASATAIYGSQGANGVVLITTKSASKDVPVVRFNAGVTVSAAGSRIEMMDFDDYVEYLAYHAQTQKNAATVLSQIYADPENREGLKVTPVDWQDYVTRTAVSQRYYLSISGRPKQTSYFFSLGYNHSEGVIRRTNSDNITASLRLQKNISRNLVVMFKTNFGYTKSDLVTGSVSGGNVTSRSSVLRSTLRSKPLVYRDPNSNIENEAMTDDDSEMMYGPDRLLAGTNNTSQRFRVIPSLTLDWKITTWLTFKSAFGGELNTEERIKTREERISVGNGNLAGVGDGKGAKFNFDNTLTAKKSWKKHNLTFTLGQSSSMNTYSSESVSGWNLPQKYAYEKDINNAISDYSQIDAFTRSRSTLLSFFARGIYNYSDRYILTATARYDGSSKFQGRNKWGFFPSLAFAEKDGTFSNTERRVQRVRKIAAVKGECRDDWWTLMQIMNRIGYPCHYDTVEDIFNELRTVTPSYAGITYEKIERNNNQGVQWPCPTEDHPGTPILHVNGPIRKGGVGLLKTLEWKPSPEAGNPEYPITLTTCRILYHYHTRTQTDRTRAVHFTAPRKWLEMGQSDAMEMKISEGEWVRIASPRGETYAEVRIVDTLQPGVVWMPFHQ